MRKLKADKDALLSDYKQAIESEEKSHHERLREAREQHDLVLKRKDKELKEALARNERLEEERHDFKT